ncbi:MAG TPA: hypothetical protein VIL90_01665 [Puia sp.]
MTVHDEILTELLGICPFLGKNHIARIPYTVPPGYFSDFPDILMSRIHLEAAKSGRVTGADRKTSETSWQEEISEISPLLAGLKNKNTYRAPEGYFDRLKAKIPESVPTKVIEISSPFSSKAVEKEIRQFSIPARIVRYAAAACIVGLIGIGIYNIMQRPVGDPINALTAISDQDMANYLNDDDIHWTPGVSSSTETASADFSDIEIHELLSSVPDNELQQYSSLPEQKRSVN